VPGCVEPRIEDPVKCYPVERRNQRLCPTGPGSRFDLRMLSFDGRGEASNPLFVVAKEAFPQVGVVAGPGDGDGDVDTGKIGLLRYEDDVCLDQGGEGVFSPPGRRLP